MHGLGLCIKLDSFVAHMFYVWSFSHNTAVPIAIKKILYYFLEYIHYFVFLGSWPFEKIYNLTIGFIYMKKMKSTQFKWSPKSCHCNHKWFIELLSKTTSQIKFLFFEYLYPLYYHILPLGLVGVKVY